MKTPYGSSRSVGNAGCLIESQGFTLLVLHRHGGKLGFPGGTLHDGEIAQCTAHRETWEETGLAVDVRSLVMQFDNGFFLYACEPQGRMDIDEPLPLPPWSRTEISELIWSDLSRIENTDWRFPEQFEELKNVLRGRRRNDSYDVPADSR